MSMPQLALVAGYLMVGIIGLLGLAVVVLVATRKIDLHLLVSEKDGPASMSRFQFLVFTFVVSMCVLVLTLESGEFPNLDADILGLLGISGGSYLAAKGIQNEKDKHKTVRRAEVKREVKEIEERSDDERDPLP